MVECPMCHETMNDFDKPDEMTDRYTCCLCEIMVTIQDISAEDEILDNSCDG